MSTPTGSNLLITEVMKSIEYGDYRIPRFQRDFVWDIKKSAELLDSIIKGYPISSIILWRTKNELTEIRNLGGITIPGRDTGRYTSYVIDGQQRLTSLYFAFKGLTTSSGSDFSTMCISLIANNDEQIVFDSMPRDANPDDYVQLKALYSAEALGGAHSEKKLRYYQILLQYTLSIIEIDDGDLDLCEVIEIFERLNLGGKKLNLFSIIAARSYRVEENGECGFDLAEKFDAINSKLEENNYGTIKDSIFLQTISACLIERVNKADILRDLNNDIIISNYPAVERAFFAAIEHLKGDKYGVKVYNLLPYASLIVSFSYYHYKMGNRPSTEEQEKFLVDYFWRSVIGKRYNRSVDTNLNADIAKMKKIVNREEPTHEPIVLSPKSIFENGKFALSSSFVTGILCLMSLNNPQSFVPGRQINITNDAVSASAKNQFHHFFPTKSAVICENTEYKKHVNNVVNIIFLDAQTNAQINNKNPSEYVPEYEKQYPNLQSVLESHFIDMNGYGLFDDKYELFIKYRSDRLYKKLCGFLIPDVNDICDDTPAII